MKHGVAFRKLSRPTAHRMMMLRNMVSSLIEHEQIQTTLPKAREAARLAEKLITLGKKGKESHKSRAQSLLVTPSLLPKVFDTLSKRYQNRPGGYTRILRYGNRPGDNAPNAILELVDGPKDTNFEMLARKVGWEVFGWKERGEHTNLYRGIEGGVESVEVLGGNAGFLNPPLRSKIQKMFKYRYGADRAVFSKKSAEYLNKLLAEAPAKSQSADERRARNKKLSKEASKMENNSVRHQNRQLWERVWDREPGQVTAGSTVGSLRISKGDLGKKEQRPWQLEKEKPENVWTPLNISARKRYVPPKVIRVKTVEVMTNKEGKRTSQVVIEEGRSLKEMPFRKKALPPDMQSHLRL